MIFSSAQSKAIKHIDGPMMVLAGPGSGKTTIITHRIKCLIESAGVSPADILVITFTRAAANEMKLRFNSLTHNAYPGVWFSTFHSVFFWIVKTAYNYNNSNILSETEKYKILLELVNKSGIIYDNKEDIVSSITRQIGLIKCDLICIDDYYSTDMPSESFRKIYNDFHSILKKNNKIDFDDMLTHCLTLLQNRPDILDICRQKFRYILVDEFQDTNKIQYEIIKLLAMPRDNIFIVGDDDQSVYSFRGAKPDIMFGFKSDFKNTKTVILGDNFRCATNITQCASNLILNNKKRFYKKFIAAAKIKGTINYYKPADIKDENEIIINKIITDFKDGIGYEQMAVLYRTNLQARRLALKLSEYNIPYNINDVLPNIFNHFIFQNLLDYIKIAMGDRSRGRFLHIINRPVRYIRNDMFLEDNVDFNRLKVRCQDRIQIWESVRKLEVDLELIKNMTPYAAISYIRLGIGYDSYLKSYAKERNIDEGELFEIIEELHSMTKDFKSYGSFFEFVEEYVSIISKENKKEKTKTGVAFMTMHSAKGLEFERVHILDCVESVIPHKKAKQDYEIEEERRMFYVAITRAKNTLNIYCPEEIFGKEKDVSRFVYEMRNNKEKN